jgi:hypothetical protein
MQGGSLAFKSRALAVEQLAFDLVASESGADLTSLSGRIGRSVFRASGLARSWSDPRLKAHVEASTDLAEVARFLPSRRLDGARRPGGGEARRRGPAGSPLRLERHGDAGGRLGPGARARLSGDERARHARPLARTRVGRRVSRPGSAAATSRSTARSSARSSS